jgi:tetratricopeptide (TPR) repeat protein
VISTAARTTAARTMLRLALTLVGAVLFGLRPAPAQPVLDLALSDAQLAIRQECAILKVNFNIRVRYANHFPISSGNELRITVNPIDRAEAAALLTLKREAARVPLNGKLAGIKAIDFETRYPMGPVLRIVFDHPVSYRVAPGLDTQSMVVAIAGAKPSASCQPRFPATLVATRPTADPRALSPGKVSDANLRAVAAWVDEGRAALKKNDFSGAIQLFMRVLKYPENEYSVEALELLGLARQKNGELAEARGVYEDYLRRYPSGESSERVRQRLAGIVTASGEPSAPLPMPVGAVETPPIGQFARTKETTWTLVGSASVFYIRDDSFRTVRDPSVAPDLTADPDAHRVHQNELLTSIDAIATWNNDQTKGKIRFSGSEENSFNSGSRDLSGVAAFLVDTLVKDWDLRAVVGRQTLNTDGVLGRFDGALLSWQALPMVKFDLVGGSPVLSRFDLPFKDDKYFYSAAVRFGPLFGALETTLYAIQQRDKSYVDREAVGTEVRYFDQSKYLFGTVDYDLHFQRLNAAIFSGSWTLPDKSTIYGGADYRRTPFLSTWNALLNQPFTTLYDMLRYQTSAQVQELALDQTPIYRSAMIGFSHPIWDRFQVAADATVVNLTQPIVPIGLDPSLATLPAGNEYYYSAQLIGNNLINDGDMYIAAFRYSQLVTSNRYVLDFNTRYPLTSDLRISPRLRLGYAVGRNGLDLKEYTVLPSVLIDYYLTKNWNLELEVGAQWTSTVQSGIKSNDTELLVTAGLRYDFYRDARVDDKPRCGTPNTALCRYATGSDGSNCASPPPGCR